MANLADGTIPHEGEVERGILDVLDGNLLIEELDWLVVPVHGSDMQKYNPADLVRLGTILGLLESVKPGIEVAEYRAISNRALSALKALREHPFLRFSPGFESAVGRLEMTVIGMGAKARTTDGGGTLMEFHLNEDHAARIQADLRDFRTVFFNECQSLDIFSVPQVQAYQTRTLLEEGERLLPTARATKLKLASRDKSLLDVREGARALAFGLWTAAGFHFARATEFLIQEYWKQERGKTTLPPKGARTWVALLRELQGRAATPTKPAVPPAGNAKLVKTLLALGEDYRNPLVHPDHSLDEADGAILIEGCLAAMSKILAALP